MSDPFSRSYPDNAELEAQTVAELAIFRASAQIELASLRQYQRLLPTVRQRTLCGHHARRQLLICCRYARQYHQIAISRMQSCERFLADLRRDEGLPF